MSKTRSFFFITIIMLITAVTFTVFSQDSDTSKCRELLKNYGWTCKANPCEKENINIPAEFDEVYKSYEIMQQEASLDLEPYKGMSGVRYTFEITNYPVDVGETVYANVIIVNGTAVAGDIMTRSVNGFMHSLKFPGYGKLNEQ